MNDDDVITTVRDRFARVDMTTPAGAVAARGQAIRRRRRGRRAAAGTVAAAALALTALVSLPAGHHGQPAPPQLAAWSVTRQAGGTVAVTVHDLRDPAGLRRALRAHGVPAIVRFHPPGSPLPSCVIPWTSRLAVIYQRVFRQPPGADPTYAGQTLTDIYPAAIPATAQIGIDAEAGGTSVIMGVELLTSTGRCLPPSSPRGGLTRRLIQ